MSEELYTDYKDGDIVWVKLGPSWWPGEVADLSKIPSEEIEFKKPPLVVVKFFEEDTYEYVRIWANIFPYNCEKKAEFIKKGMASFRSKAPHMEKFPKDVTTAEVKLGGNPNILSDPAYRPEKKRNYVAEVFGTPSPKVSSIKKSRSSTKHNPKDTSHITHRRFLGLDDYKAYICIQYPGKDRMGDSEDEEIIRINREPDQIYNCHSCTYSTKRLEVMVLHTKSHIQGVYVSKPKRKRPVTGRSRKKEHIKRRSAHSDDSSSEERARPPKEKKRKTKTTAISKTSQKPVEPKPKVLTDIRNDLLAEWEDSDDEENSIFDDTTKHSDDLDTTKHSDDLDITKHSDDIDTTKQSDDLDTTKQSDDLDTTKHSDNLDTTQNSDGFDTTGVSKYDSTLDFSDKINDVLKENENDDKELSEGENEKSTLKNDSNASKLQMDKETQEAIKSCFDFDEDDEENILINTAVEVGRKIPRVIPPTEKRKSEILDDIIDLEEGINKEEILKMSQSFNERTKSKEKEQLESAFKDLMDTTSVPSLPEIDNDLKPAQNFHVVTTIKFPDKPEESPKKDREKKSEIPINPKKRFVKSFEDFENQLQQEENRRKEEELLKKKQEQYEKNKPEQITKKDDTHEDKDKSLGQVFQEKKSSFSNDRRSSLTQEKQALAKSETSILFSQCDSSDSSDDDSNKVVDVTKLQTSIMSKIIQEAKIPIESKDRIMAKMKNKRLLRDQALYSEETVLSESRNTRSKIESVSSANKTAVKDIVADTKKNLPKVDKKFEDEAAMKTKNFKSTLTFSSYRNRHENMLKLDRREAISEAADKKEDTFQLELKPDIVKESESTKEKKILESEPFKAETTFLLEANNKNRESEKDNIEDKIIERFQTLSPRNQKNEENLKPERNNSKTEKAEDSNSLTFTTSLNKDSFDSEVEKTALPITIEQENKEKSVSELRSLRSTSQESNTTEKQDEDQRSSKVPFKKSRWSRRTSHLKKEVDLLTDLTPVSLPVKIDKKLVFEVTQRDDIFSERVRDENTVKDPNTVKEQTFQEIQNSEVLSDVNLDDQEHTSVQTTDKIKSISLDLFVDKDTTLEFSEKSSQNEKMETASEESVSESLSNGSKIPASDSEVVSEINNEISETINGKNIISSEIDNKPSSSEQINEESVTKNEVSESVSKQSKRKKGRRSRFTTRKKRRYIANKVTLDKNKDLEMSEKPDTENNYLENDLSEYTCLPQDAAIHISEVNTNENTDETSVIAENNKLTSEEPVTEIEAIEEETIFEVTIEQDSSKSHFDTDTELIETAEKNFAVVIPEDSSISEILVEEQITSKVPLTEEISDTVAPKHEDQDILQSLTNEVPINKNSKEQVITQSALYGAQEEMTVSKRVSKRESHKNDVQMTRDTKNDLTVDSITELADHIEIMDDIPNVESHATKDPVENKDRQSFLEVLACWAQPEEDSKKVNKEQLINEKRLETEKTNAIEDKDEINQLTPDVRTHEENVEKQVSEEIVDQEQLNEENVVHKQLGEESVVHKQSPEENVVQEQSIAENVDQEQSIEENVDQEQSIEEKVDQEQSIEENVDKEQLIEENVNQEQSIEENVDKEQSIEENVVHKPLAEENVVHKQLTVETLVQEQLVEENVDQMQHEEERVVEEQLREYVIKSQSAEENVAAERVTEENVDMEQLKEENVDMEQLAKENVDKEQLIKENVDTKLLTENIVEPANKEHFVDKDTSSTDLELNKTSEHFLSSLFRFSESKDEIQVGSNLPKDETKNKSELKKSIGFNDMLMDDEDDKLTDLVSDIVQKLSQDESDKTREDLDLENIEGTPKKIRSSQIENDTPFSDNESKKKLETSCEKLKDDDDDEHSGEVEILCASNSQDAFKFSIQTNLTNLSRSEEISAIALATLSEIKPDVESGDSSSNISTPKTDLNFPEKLSETEMVAIEGNLTVMSEKDLADAQVEITTEKVISSKKPVMLSSFSMDFSDSTSDSGSLNEVLNEGTKFTDFDSKGTEFTTRAMTKELKPKTTSKKVNAYDQCELLDILEGNTDLDKKIVGYQTPSKSFAGDIMDFEECIPSQIVCTKQFQKNIDDEMKKDKSSSVMSTTSKLLERLTDTKNVENKNENIDSPVKNVNNQNQRTKAKPIIISEQIIKPATTESKIVAPTSNIAVNDIEDVEAFVIHKDLKKNVEETETKVVPVKAARKPRVKPTGKAKILQQTIITPAGEILQPLVTLPKKKTAPVSATVTRISAESLASIVSNNSTKPSTTIVTNVNVDNPNQDDNIFDIFNMPIVLSDQILTPESIENMPIVIDGNAVKSTQSLVTKVSANKTVTKVTSNVSPIVSSTKSLNVTPNPKPRILQTLGAKAVLTQKPGKYIIMTQGSPAVPQQKVVTKKTIMKKTSLPASIGSKTDGSPEITGNKIMVVTNHQGQQQRLLLTPAQQKVLGYQSPSGPKLAKTVVKTNILQQNLLTTISKSEAGSSKMPSLLNQKIVATSLVPNPQVSKPLKSIIKSRAAVNQKATTVGIKTAKTILITNKHGQTIKKIATTEDDIDKQVAEQLEAIKASSGMQFGNQSNKTDIINNKTSPKTQNRKIYGKKSELKSKLTPVIARPDLTNPPPLVSTSKKLISTLIESKKVGEDPKPQQDRPLNQLVIQDALGNQTTITEGQILALPSETVDGQPQSYMLVTLDQSGNLTPLNNEALMNLDPNLGGDLSNMVLQIDQGSLGGNNVDQPVPLAQPATVKLTNPGEELQAGTSKIDIPRARAPLLLPVASDLPQIEPQKVHQSIITPPAEPSVNIESIVSNSNSEQGQQLFVTGDPIATQKFLESLTEGTTDLANIIANAEGKSILIQADGQQILINTNTDSQLLQTVGESTEGGGNPIFATQPNKNTDILAAALADTDVFTSQPKISQLSPNNALYPINVGNVLETSLTLSSPIMTPLEVPSTNSKKIPDDEADILTQVPKNVDLPITITDPNISQTVANQQVATLMASELHTNLELGLGLSETTISSGSVCLTSPGYGYSLPTLDENDISHKPFNSSMPLLNDDVEVPPSRNDSQEKDDDRNENLNSEGFLEEESRFTLGGGMCSSLSEPPPEMFDLPDVNSYCEKNGNISLSLQSTPDPKDDDTTDVSIQAESSSEGSCEIPLQPKIVAKSVDFSEDSQI